MVGAVNRDAALFEQFALGGGPSPLIDQATLTQRVVMPALPVGVQVGSSVIAYRASVAPQPLVLYFWDGSTRHSPERRDTGTGWLARNGRRAFRRCHWLERLQRALKSGRGCRSIRRSKIGWGFTRR